MAFQERGLSNAFDADPMDQVRKQLEIGPPADDAEKEKRKGIWSQVLAKISADPNLQRAMMMAGIQMMQAPQPGQTAGGQIAQGLMTGLTAYEGGKAAQQEQERAQREEQRVERRETRMDEQHRAQMEQIRAELEMIPDEKERRRIERELKKVELQYAPATAQARISSLQAQAQAAARGGQAAMRMTDQEQAVQAYMNLPEVQGLPEAQRRAVATRMYIEDSRGVPARTRVNEADQEALAIYRMYEQMDPAERDFQLQFGGDRVIRAYARGKQLAEQEGGAVTAPQGTAPQQAPAAPESKVISAAEIRKALEKRRSEEQRTSSGMIR